MNPTIKLTFQAPPTSPIFATVLHCADPDVGLGQRVQVTGYTALVKSISRRNTMGEQVVSELVTHAFDLGDLRLEHESESMQEIDDQMQSAIDKHATAPKITRQREKLPDTRYALTHKFDVGGQKGYVTLGFYDMGIDGNTCYHHMGESEMDLSRPGEIFIVVQRQGSTLQGFADAWARSVSMLLQYGVPVSEVCRMFAWHKFEPRGITPNADIKIANSIVDYVARWLGHTCIANYQPGGEPVNEVTDAAR